MMGATGDDDAGADVVVPCDDEQQARDQAAWRAALDPDAHVYYWNAVCLDGRWFAKRYPREAAHLPEPKQSFSGAVLEVIRDAFIR